MPSAMAAWMPPRLELVKLMRQRRPAASRALIISSRYSPRGGKVTMGSGSRSIEGLRALSTQRVFSGQLATASRLLRRCLSSTRSSSPRS
ncbi:hypothetical protein D3C81_1844160 [compost metagenome]